MQVEKKVVLKAEAISTIAHDVLGIATLEVQNSDSLDFHDLSVDSIHAALEEAYEAGFLDSLRLQKDRK